MISFDARSLLQELQPKYEEQMVKNHSNKRHLQQL